MHLYIFFIGLFVAQSYAQTPFDELIDEVLLEAEQKMVNESKTNYDIPTISYAIDKKLLFWDVKGQISATGGYVGNLSTIQRIGDVTPVETDNLVITATFGLSNLFVHFDDIQIDFLLFHMKDGLDFKIGENAISFNITFQYDSDGNCKVVLNKAELTSLGGFHTTLLPDTLNHKIADFFITGALDIVSFEIKKVVNSNLTSRLNGVIQELDLCDKLPMATKSRLAYLSLNKVH